MTSAQGFGSRAPSLIVATTLAETTLLLGTSSKVFLLPNFAVVVRMITTSKDGFCDKSDAEILNSLKDCLVVTWILSVKP